MSVYHCVEVDFSDEKCLVDSLIEMGFKPEVHADSQQLHGYHGDLREQRGHVIIPRKQVGSASNDIGFEKVNGKFIAHVSAYDQGKWNKTTYPKLKQLYGKTRVLAEMKRTGKYRLIKQQVDAEGKISVRLRVGI